MNATHSIERPQPGEYAEYAGDYIRRVPDGDLAAFLSAQADAFRELFAQLGEARGNTSYAPGKWTLKQELGHLVDVERIFSYRALCFARNEAAPLPGFEQDDYVRNSDLEKRTLADLLEELLLLRRANVLQFRALTAETSRRSGTASGHPGVTVRAVLYSLAGHAQRHLELIRERYAGGAKP